MTNSVEDRNQELLGQKLLDDVKIENEKMRINNRLGYQRQKLLGWYTYTKKYINLFY